MPIQHMSRRSLVRRIKNNYLEHMQQISNVLENADYVCTTADIWSCNTGRFLGVTVHWV